MTDQSKHYRAVAKAVSAKYATRSSILSKKGAGHLPLRWLGSAYKERRVPPEKSATVEVESNPLADDKLRKHAHFLPITLQNTI